MAMHLPGALLWLLGHALAVWGARADSQFPQVFARHIKHRGYLEA